MSKVRDWVEVPFDGAFEDAAEYAQYIQNKIKNHEDPEVILVMKGETRIPLKPTMAEQIIWRAEVEAEAISKAREARV